jgi:hypothetical protein
MYIRYFSILVVLLAAATARAEIPTLCGQESATELPPGTRFKIGKDSLLSCPTEYFRERMLGVRTTEYSFPSRIVSEDLDFARAEQAAGRSLYFKKDVSCLFPATEHAHESSGEVLRLVSATVRMPQNEHGFYSPTPDSRGSIYEFRFIDRYGRNLLMSCMVESRFRADWQRGEGRKLTVAELQSMFSDVFTPQIKTETLSDDDCIDVAADRHLKDGQSVFFDRDAAPEQKISDGGAKDGKPAPVVRAAQAPATRIANPR